MTTAELLPKAKKWIGYTSSTMEDIIQDDMDACLLDLKNGGVVVLDPADKLIQTAMRYHLKGYVVNNGDSQRYVKSYEHLKKALALSGEYNTERAGD